MTNSSYYSLILLRIVENQISQRFEGVTEKIHFNINEMSIVSSVGGEEECVPCFETKYGFSENIGIDLRTIGEAAATGESNVGQKLVEERTTMLMLNTFYRYANAVVDEMWKNYNQDKHKHLALSVLIVDPSRDGEKMGIGPSPITYITHEAILKLRGEITFRYWFF